MCQDNKKKKGKPLEDWERLKQIKFTSQRTTNIEANVKLFVSSTGVQWPQVLLAILENE